MVSTTERLGSPKKSPASPAPLPAQQYLLVQTLWRNDMNWENLRQETKDVKPIRNTNSLNFDEALDAFCDAWFKCQRHLARLKPSRGCKDTCASPIAKAARTVTITTRIRTRTATLENTAELSIISRWKEPPICIYVCAGCKSLTTLQNTIAFHFPLQV